jgi:hypothetical protein
MGSLLYHLKRRTYIDVLGQGAERIFGTRTEYEEYRLLGCGAV